jgi:hypothetical protein
MPCEEGARIGDGGRNLPTGEAWIPDTRRLALLDAAFRDDEAEGAAEMAGRVGWARERRRRPGGFGALTLAGSAEAWIPETRRLASLGAAFRDDEGKGRPAGAAGAFGRRLRLPFRVPG